MPLREGVCSNTLCSCGGVRQEHYYKRSDDPPVACDHCGQPTKFVISAANPVWLKPINSYNSPNIHDRHAQNSEGHIAYRTRSSRLVGGAPEPVQIRSIQDQREYCKAEGLAMPSDLPAVSRVSDDGMKISGRGLPGQEV
jgi:hypothetical protein